MAKTQNDILQAYREADAEGRYSILMKNFVSFPKILRKLEKMTMYRIKIELEHARSKSIFELGVRVQTSGVIDKTANEAIENLLLDEAVSTGTIAPGLLNGIDNAAGYVADIRMIRIMRLDFELLEELIEDLDEEDTRMLKKYMLDGCFFKEIADEQGKSYEAIKKRMDRIRSELKNDMITCLEMGCKEENIFPKESRCA